MGPGFNLSELVDVKKNIPINRNLVHNYYEFVLSELIHTFRNNYMPINIHVYGFYLRNILKQEIPVFEWYRASSSIKFSCRWCFQLFPSSIKVMYPSSHSQDCIKCPYCVGL